MQIGFNKAKKLKHLLIKIMLEVYISEFYIKRKTLISFFKRSLEYW